PVGHRGRADRSAVLTDDCRPLRRLPLRRVHLVPLPTRDGRAARSARRTGGRRMSQNRKRRGYRTQKVVADWLRENGWPHATSTGAGRQGADVENVPDLAIE